MYQLIVKEYFSQTNMKTLVLIMLIFLFLNIAISIQCFTSAYGEATRKGWISSQSAAKIRFLIPEGRRPDPILSLLFLVF